MLTGHMLYATERILSGVYVYDPTDDGPECEIITRICASFPSLDPVVAEDIRKALDLATTVSFGLQTGVLAL